MGNKNSQSLGEKIKRTLKSISNKVLFGILRRFPDWIQVLVGIVIAVGVIIIFIGTVMSGIVNIKSFFLANMNNTILEPERLTDENKNKYDDFNERWEYHLGSFLQSENDPNYFGLSSTTEKGLLKFRNPFSERELVIFDFTPLSKDTANIIMHVNDLYEIVIGDNDYKTLTFKARESWNGSWKIIPTTKGEDKLNMYTGIKRGTDVRARMFGYCQMDGKYLVKLEIKFKPDQINEGKYQILAPEYIFTPPFQECMPLDISVGLINPNYKSGIEARFLSFKIQK